MRGDSIHIEQMPSFQKQKALAALAIAKELEKKALQSGKTYVRVDEKTIKLK